LLVQRLVNRLDAAATVLYLSVEGEKREKVYFEALTRKTGDLGAGRFTLYVDAATHGQSAPPQVLQRALAFHTIHSYPAERIWLVMDMDRQHVPLMEEMLTRIQEIGFSLALSNPCFELWLWLHQHDIDPTHDYSACGPLKSLLTFDLSAWMRAPDLNALRASNRNGD
jgi:hypothetical protein